MADATDKTNNSGHGSAHEEHAHGDHSHGGHGDSAKLTDVIRLTTEGGTLGIVALAVGVLGIVASVLLGGGLFGKEFQHAYLAAFMWGASISIGALFWVTLQHLMASRASVVLRRLGELLAQGVGVVAVLSLPLLIPVLTHNATLYSWLDHDVVEKMHLHAKEGYLNSSAFLIRMAVYFTYFIFFAWYLLKTSVKQDGGEGKALASRLQARSAPGMIAFALSTTFFAIDFLMTLDPIWFSTIFGVYYFSTCVLTFHSVLALGTSWLQKKGLLTSAVTREHYHDIGKLMFGFIVFWTYIGFSQFMLIWYANIPEETHWFHDRMEGNWLNGTLVLAAVHFVIPFFGMMSREVKRNKKVLSFWSVWILAVCWFDMYWLVAPNLYKDGIHIGLVDLTTVLGVGGVLLWFALWRAKGVSLVATGDPRLAQSLAFENI